MSGTYSIVMGDRGRLVVPVELRERLHLDPGVHLLLVDTPLGVVLLTRDQAKKRLQERLSDIDLIGELLSDRRAQATADDVT